MLDIQYIRDNVDDVKEKSVQKGYEIDIDRLLKLDAERRELLQKIETLRTERNQLQEQAKGSRPSEEQVQKGKQLREQVEAIELEFQETNKEYEQLLKTVPNMPLEDVPIGSSEDQNVVIKTVGEAPRFNFQPKTHSEIAEAKGWLDKVRAAKVAGSRFAYLRGDLVKLQFAIIQMITTKLSDQEFIREVIAENNLNVSDKPFTPVLPPYMLRTELYDAMDRLEPRDDRYKIEGEDLWLQGSAEHVLGSMHANEIFEESELPIRYVGYATSFRKEAGTYGKDMDGMFRMHQFDKLEMESLTTAETGLDEHLLLIAIQEKVMQLLEIPYQVIHKCTFDIGKPNARGIDINAWMPGQAAYRETHTADYMTDYQSRRLKTRVRRTDGTIELVHTNDATALPLSRGPIAIIENHQTADSSVIIPEVLRQFLGGKEKI